MADTALGIGALSKACGIPAETLRTWERRYGFPVPLEREESTHRRYPLEAVERLRLIKTALANGNKPSAVVGAPLEDLHQLVALEGSAANETHRHDPLVSWFTAVEMLDAEALDRAFARDWDERGAMRFLEELAAPFLVELGERWNRGDISVAHEHFASHRLAGFLTLCRERSGLGSRQKCVLVTTLPGEQHTLGAHMAAVIFNLAGLQVVFLGPDTPVRDLAQAANRRGAVAVAVSASIGYPREQLQAQIRQLSRELSPSMTLFVGGAGAAGDTEAVYITDFDTLLNKARLL